MVQKQIDLYPSICNICGGKVIYTSNATIYGKEYGSGKCYLCTECGAYVGTHKPWPKKALGILANNEMKREKRICHGMFDSLWQDENRKRQRYKRTVAYKELAVLMDIPSKDCHIGYFDMEELKKAEQYIGIMRPWMDFVDQILESHKCIYGFTKKLGRDNVGHVKIHYGNSFKLEKYINQSKDINALISLEQDSVWKYKCLLLYGEYSKLITGEIASKDSCHTALIKTEIEAINHIRIHRKNINFVHAVLTARDNRKIDENIALLEEDLERMIMKEANLYSSIYLQNGEKRIAKLIKKYEAEM